MVGVDFGIGIGSSIHTGSEIAGIGVGKFGFAIGPGIGIGVSSDLVTGVTPQSYVGSGYGIRAGLGVGPAIPLPGRFRTLSIGIVMGPGIGFSIKQFPWKVTRV